MVRDRPGLPHAPSPFLVSMGIARYVRRVAWLAAYGRNLWSWGRRVGARRPFRRLACPRLQPGLVAAGIARPAGAALIYDVHDLHSRRTQGLACQVRPAASSAGTSGVY